MADQNQNQNQSGPMQEVVNMVSQRTGLGEDMSRTAVNTVIGFLKDRLPAPISTAIDTYMNKGAVDTSNLGNLGSELGGMFGKKGNK